MVISHAIYDDAEVQELMRSENLQAAPFEIMLKGFDEERFELWRVSRLAQSTATEKAAADLR